MELTISAKSRFSSAPNPEELYEKMLEDFKIVLRKQYENFRNNPTSHRKFSEYFKRYENHSLSSAPFEKYHNVTWAEYWSKKMDRNYKHEVEIEKPKIWKKLQEKPSKKEKKAATLKNAANVKSGDLKELHNSTDIASETKSTSDIDLIVPVKSVPTLLKNFITEVKLITLEVEQEFDKYRNDRDSYPDIYREMEICLDQYQNVRAGEENTKDQAVKMILNFKKKIFHEYWIKRVEVLKKEKVEMKVDELSQNWLKLMPKLQDEKVPAIELRDEVNDATELAESCQEPKDTNHEPVIVQTVDYSETVKNDDELPVKRKRINHGETTILHARDSDDNKQQEDIEEVEISGELKEKASHDALKLLKIEEQRVKDWEIILQNEINSSFLKASTPRTDLYEIKRDMTYLSSWLSMLSSQETEALLKLQKVEQPGAYFTLQNYLSLVSKKSILVDSNDED